MRDGDDLWLVSVGQIKFRGLGVCALKEDDGVRFECEKFFVVECGVEDGAWLECICCACDLKNFVEVCVWTSGSEWLCEDEDECFGWSGCFESFDELVLLADELLAEFGGFGLAVQDLT